jgi:hypothetical protein
VLLGVLSRASRDGSLRFGPGELLAACVALAIVIAWTMMAMVGFSYGTFDAAIAEISGGLEQALKSAEGSEIVPEGIPVSDFVRLLVVSAPAIMSFWSVMVFALNLWLAGRVVAISGRLGRAWPDLPTSLRLPRTALVLFAGATLACLLPGVWRVAAASAASALGVAFAMQGLAAIHRLTRGRNARAGLLSALYALILFLFPLPLFIAAGVGIADNVRPLRRSPANPASTSI